MMEEMLEFREKKSGTKSLTFKYLFLCFNTLYLISGGVLLGISLWLTLVKHTYLNLLSDSSSTVATYLLLICGVGVVVFGVLGFIGTLYNVTCILIIYSIIIALVFFMELVAGIIALKYHKEIDNELREDLRHAVRRDFSYYKPRTDALNEMQKNFHCCGADSYKDWEKSEWLLNTITDNKVPDTCCKSISEGCATRVHPSNIYHKGCHDKLKAYLKDKIFIIGCTGIILCCFQIFGIVLSCYLMARALNP
ncbi:CD151 antigen-like [Argonauta hians]